jgi:hypothetical protein
MTTAQLESRLTTLEREVAGLKAERQATQPRSLHPLEVLQRTHGTFADDEAFREAARLGRKWRASLDAQPRRKSKAKA